MHAGSKAGTDLSKFTINTTNLTTKLQVVYNNSRASVHEDKAFRNQSRKSKCTLYQKDHDIVNRIDTHYLSTLAQIRCDTQHVRTNLKWTFYRQ